jgi:hypothetical protein
MVHSLYELVAARLLVQNVAYSDLFREISKVVSASNGPGEFISADKIEIERAIKHVRFSGYTDPQYLMRMAMGYPQHAPFLNPYSLKQTVTSDATGASKYYGRAAPIPAFSRPDEQRQRGVGGVNRAIQFEHYGYRANHAVNSYMKNI